MPAKFAQTTTRISVHGTGDSPHSQYVRADDYEAVRLESEVWRARAMRAEQMNRDLLRSALEGWNR